MDISYLLRRSAATHGARFALRCDGRARTYTELDGRAHRFANALQAMGLAAGDRVAVLLHNCIEFPEVDLGLAVGGFVRVALNTRLRADELAFVLADCRASAVVTDSGFDAALEEACNGDSVLVVRIDEERDRSARARAYEPLLAAASDRRHDVQVDPGAPAWISYTSGTTGRPKGVVLTQRTLIQVALNFMIQFGQDYLARSILLTQPLSHGSGYFVLAYLMAGGTMHVMPRFDPERAVALGREHDIPLLKAVPTMLQDLLAVSDRPAFDTILYGAAPMPRDQIEACLDRFGPVLAQLYGQSEAPMTITFLSKRDHASGGKEVESAGRAWPNVALDIVDDNGRSMEPGELGELVVRAPHLMEGYYRRPDVTEEVLRDGRLWTRDMACLDERGFVYLRGRRDEMIISGGYNIAPKEIESVLTDHPAVEECVVMPMSHPRWGQVPRAFVLLGDGAKLDADAMVVFCRERLGFRRPRSVVVVPSIPRTPYGKVDRAALVGVASHEISMD